ncbi:hypothetical protein D8B26_000735 [Coccidioides posadasii str. Silveira]|uniref:Uncharacterized protein n=2 Tax=Coccidioides posadasii TaxID=199306 RepID=E9CSF5_COCPS|nr:hypothetical protein CPC735_037020 [Coccidioides posadasii C735 delta SOWgp]EER28996.1 hypothetical protein CPC735_037020 [Coccidioides posadasii C735 delta SOWgp]EFW22615.1 conserved hypothetical protein [Coccidioides posadasii str. Silveira]QVM06023.1 hypothetical protein D8B26_000735 [Coccidioides posadasii str. Silveira]|eukprot:XP_003071141.1 hypothetical protein CPC735_037020 [Coccidioides posadasii C735 delta SOWgp]
MSLSIPPLSPSSKRRRPLHERTPSQSNERPPASTLRLVMDKSSEDEADIYSTDPYPTKPEHILLPTPSDNQYGGPLTSNPVSASFHNDSTDTSPSSAEYASRNFPEDHGGSVSELSTLVQEGNLSSFIWGESQNSSNTSIPHLATPVIDEAVEAGDEKSESSDRTRLPPLNTTIKTVPQDDSTPEQSDSGLTSSSSPNVVRLGLTSSPNVIPLESSSPNFMPLVTSSPYYVKESASDSSLYSANTFGTARRYVRPQQQNSGFLERDSNQSLSFSSDPPSAILRTHRSTSSFALSRGGSTHTRTASASTRSGQSPSDIQTIIDSGLPVKYPTIQSPPSAGSLAEGSSSRLPSQSSQLTRYQPGRNRLLSIVPSEWSAERALSSASASPQVDQTDSSTESSGDNAIRGRPSDFSIRLVAQSESDEGADTLSQLQPCLLRTKRSGSLSNRSMVSRFDSFRLMSRPGSSASSILNTIPTWAKVYYRSGGAGLQLSALSLVEGSRPSTAASARPAAHLGPLEISRTRSRPRKNTDTRLALPTADTRDPRTHWAGGFQQSERNVPKTPSQEDLPANWSPHLFPDHRTGSVRRSLWNPPSLDESAEGIIGWRNVQIYLFCLGFLVPLTWFVAAFLPLPPKVFPLNEEFTTDQPDVERTFNNRVKHIDQIRYENARWWRRLNRFMTPVGLIIIATIATLSVLGTKNII